MGDRISVLLADDHPVVISGLARFLERLPDVDVLGSASSFDDLIARLRAERSDAVVPDVVVVDLGMPGMQGTDSVRALAALDPAPGVVVFSMQPEDQYAVDLLLAGACAYLNKGRAPEEVAEAIRRAARKRRYLTETLSERLLFRDASARAPGRSAHEGLSPREREVFRGLVAGRSAKEVASDLGVALSSVHSYTERIKRKLGASSVTELVHYAHRHGLVD